jgi:hypothetical protein
MPIAFPALLVWLRHVGCTFFQEPLAQLRAFDKAHPERHVPVGFITIGSQKKANQFCGKLGLHEGCLGDPERLSYRAMGLDEFNMFNMYTDPALKKRRAENKAAGFSQNWPATRILDSAQLPGAAIIDVNGVIRWIYRGAHPGDLPPMEDMLERAHDLVGGAVE